MNDPKTILEPIAGYVFDLVAKLRNRQFVPHSLTKLHNLKTCRDMTGATTAVEIGSYKGVTTKRLSYLFEKVVSVEIDEALYRQAARRCAARKNVELLLGDGSKLLPEIATRVDRALIFLDGHFSGGETGQGDEPEPVLKELDLIAPFISNFVAIVVDDFRLFGVEPGWPRKSEVIQKLETLLPETQWRLSVLNDQFLVVRKLG
ncbi:MAG: class I SAM-dependent methyltransferase [Mesorhizobium sp.]|uniref:class I SAM-dependent methyltransferase n=1 Tax=unclassified Mesorhizobium TaxID=325217 RepID=UPI000FCA1B4A|nr:MULTISPECIES: class I SAM-dependent methyltransferase [unclassified Mesorhizobium]RUV70439.1 class I SAM-dependent methyltransferase [Mesorhizobium sp. M5C.F.Cr.IN.023.01.1.1]RWF87879.1 MAG: class I SAM-dependent methyltransferase [Mesorhizobium sp.]RWF96858.1 MAG: class I SAM-dependent methyltransferase [Mesorhizobium sp.]RWI41788.1 MAG: class I SAM-dependent methyltransferase [Mesorhizobium sp.]RWI50949.1 MAG: class I SAM-dependent methyltransferase [Mesorhizobium sp.]